jgi:PPOX class probable F420-dependent enzyme
VNATPIPELDVRFSSPGAEARSWAEVVDRLTRAEISFLTTVRADGRPHVTPLPTIWFDDALHFCTGPEEQKARNLARDPRCAVTTGSDRFREGLDVVVEGRAERVVDDRLLHGLAERWLHELDWRFDVVDGAFHDPEATGVAHVFAVVPDKILAFGKGEPFSQTRFGFGR